MNAVLTVETALLPFDRIQTYHPHFSSPDADIALLSVDGTVFRTYSHVLRSTSGLFQTLFSLPQPTHYIPCSEEHERPIDSSRPIHAAAAGTIPVYETAFLLSYLLPLITGKVPPQPLHSLPLSKLTRLLFLAEKWDTPGPISQIRNVINGSRSGFDLQLFSPNSLFGHLSSAALHMPPPPSLHSSRRKPGPPTGFFRTDPLRIYVLAQHFGWREEAERAAASLLALSMDELKKRWEEVQEGKVDRRDGEESDVIMFTPTNKDWEVLVDLRRRRCEAFEELINSQEKFTAGNNYNCVRCGHTKLDNSPWETLKKAMIAELETRPSGDNLLTALVIPQLVIPQPSYSGGLEAAAMPSHVTARPVGDVDVRLPHNGLWPELLSCLRAKCPNEECAAPNYDSLATVKQIKNCVEMLPWKIIS